MDGTKDLCSKHKFNAKHRKKKSRKKKSPDGKSKSHTKSKSKFDTSRNENDKDYTHEKEVTLNSSLDNNSITKKQTNKKKPFRISKTNHCIKSKSKKEDKLKRPTLANKASYIDKVYKEDSENGLC